jgi:hypothetical protein
MLFKCIHGFREALERNIIRLYVLNKYKQYLVDGTVNNIVLYRSCTALFYRKRLPQQNEIGE